MGRYKARRGGKKARPERREISADHPDALDALEGLAPAADGPADAEAAAAPPAGEPGPDRPAGRPPRPPEIFLRQCPYEEAMHRLQQQVRAHVRHGTAEVLAVHGRGRGSPGGRGVLGDAVRAWCNDHPELVLDWRPAPPFWGGDGALVLTLNV